MPDQEPRATGSSVQSVTRALDLLELLGASETGLTLSQLASQAKLPLPTTHRLVNTLVERGYVRHERTKRYSLGPSLIQLGDAANRMVGNAAGPHLAALAAAAGESANLAVLEGDSVLYVAQAPGPQSMRMFTQPGRRVEPHCTAVGKAMLALMSDDEALAMLTRTGMPAKTDATITEPDRLIKHLALVRRRGYALDDGEQEIGVRCVAVAIPDVPGKVAVSVSGPSARIPDTRLKTVVDALQRASQALQEELAAG